MPRVLAAAIENGPPASGSVDRGLLLEFLAIHFVRNPNWRSLISGLIERQVAEQRHEGPEHQGLRTVLRSDRYWVDTLLRQIPQVASLLGSTQWALLRFEMPWLATCDQPLVAVPFLPPGTPVPYQDKPTSRRDDRVPVRPRSEPCPDPLVARCAGLVELGGR